MAILNLHRPFIFILIVVCCCGFAQALKNRGCPARMILSPRISLAMSFSPQKDRSIYSHQQNRRMINLKSSPNSGKYSSLQSTTLGKVSELTSAANEDSTSCISGSSSSRSDSRSDSINMSSGDDDHVSSGPRRVLKTTVPSTHTLAHARELKITIGPDTIAPSFCYFEKQHSCTGAAKTGICPVDGRPCGSNRSYIDHIYNNSRHQSSSLQGRDGGAHLSDHSATNLRQRGLSPSQHEYYNSANLSNSKGVSNQEVNRLIDDRRRQQRQQHLSAYFSQDPLEEIRPLPAIPTEYPARFIYDIVDTFKVAMHVGKLVLSIIIAMLSDTVNKNFRYYQHDPDNHSDDE